MSKIETLEQAVEWCQLHAATVKFLDGVHVFIAGDPIGDGETFIDAVDDAELFLYAESRRSEALLEEEE